MVTDENDNAPRIDNPNCKDAVRIMENLEGTPVLSCKFFVKDGDSGPNGQVKCNLKEENTPHFELLPLFSQSSSSYLRDEENRQQSYIVKVKHSFDREDSSLWQNGNPSFTIICTDSPLDARNRQTSTLEVNVIIEDQNDCEPKIPKNKENLEVFENEHPGSVVGSLEAEDCDSGKILTYLIINLFFC